ncbi:tubulin polyglutamylase TTLL5-like isoform X1 [Vespula maculifrons]
MSDSNTNAIIFLNVKDAKSVSEECCMRILYGSIMLSQRKATTIRKLEGKRPKESMSSSSLSGMSQLSNSSEETLEPFVHKPHNSNTEKRTTKEQSPINNEWLLSSPVGNKAPTLRFKCCALSTPPEDPPAKQLHMTYKIFQTDTKLINLLLQSHGLSEEGLSKYL